MIRSKVSQATSADRGMTGGGGCRCRGTGKTGTGLIEIGTGLMETGVILAWSSLRLLGGWNSLEIMRRLGVRVEDGVMVFIDVLVEGLLSAMWHSVNWGTMLLWWHI